MNSASRRVRFAILALAALAAGCAAPPSRDEPHACPNCGDPLMRLGPDGKTQIVERWRLSSWTPGAPADSAR
jgi:hypothetical protein